MSTSEILNLVAIIVGPLAAVIITLWYQTRSEKRNVKQNAFMNLIAYRHVNPNSSAYSHFVNVLNTIDVVFHGDKEVIRLWHELYELLTSTDKPEDKIRLKKIELLHAMGKSLGYTDLQQITLDKFYTPEHWPQNIQKNLQMEQNLSNLFESLPQVFSSIQTAAQQANETDEVSKKIE